MDVVIVLALLCMFLLSVVATWRAGLAYYKPVNRYLHSLNDMSDPFIASLATNVPDHNAGVEALEKTHWFTSAIWVPAATVAMVLGVGMMVCIVYTGNIHYTGIITTVLIGWFVSYSSHRFTTSDTYATYYVWGLNVSLWATKREVARLEEHLSKEMGLTSTEEAIVHSTIEAFHHQIETLQRVIAAHKK